MQSNDITRIFVDGSNEPNRWTQEVYPEGDNSVRLEGDADRDVRLRANAICTDTGKSWSVNQVVAGAWVLPPFEIDKTDDEETAQYSTLVESLEQRLGATGLTVLVSSQKQ